MRLIDNLGIPNNIHTQLGAAIDKFGDNPTFTLSIMSSRSTTGSIGSDPTLWCGNGTTYVSQALSEQSRMSEPGKHPPSIEPCSVSNFTGSVLVEPRATVAHVNGDVMSFIFKWFHDKETIRLGRRMDLARFYHQMTIVSEWDDLSLFLITSSESVLSEILRCFAIDEKREIIARIERMRNGGPRPAMTTVWQGANDYLELYILGRSHICKAEEPEGRIADKSGAYIAEFGRYPSLRVERLLSRGS
jgi:hypothetical protein